MTAGLRSFELPPGRVRNRKPPRPPRRPRRRRRDGPTWVRVQVCCNWPEDGQFAERCWALEFGDRDVCLAGDPLGEGVVFRWLAGGFLLQFGRRRYGRRGHGQWVGSWCWDSTEMNLHEARRLLQHSLERGFQVDDVALENNPFLDLVEAHEARLDALRAGHPALARLEAAEGLRRPTAPKQPLGQPPAVSWPLTSAELLEPDRQQRLWNDGGPRG